MLRTILCLLAWFATVLAFVALAARFVPVINHAVLITAALSPYLTICTSVLAATLLIGVSPRLAALALLPAVVAAAIQSPLFVRSDSPSGDAVAVRVLSANVREGFAAPGPLAGLARDRADVFVLQELTPELAEQLSGLDRPGPSTRPS